jgi:Class II Aldolase and Adducin N-terminal domain
VWDSQDEFGDTNLLVSTRAQGASLARALSGGDWTILMRQHGVIVAGRSVREVVFRSIYGAHDAEVLAKAMSLGVARPLSPSEHEAAGAFNLSPIAIDRAWEQWCRRAGAHRAAEAVVPGLTLDLVDPTAQKIDKEARFRRHMCGSGINGIEYPRRRPMTRQDGHEFAGRQRVHRHVARE